MASLRAGLVPQEFRAREDMHAPKIGPDGRGASSAPNRRLLDRREDASES
jgi:hypothetical protein